MNIIENGLYSYPNGIGHCKHGLVIIKRNEDGELYAKDTYWSSGGALYNIEDIKGDIEFLLDLNNVMEVSKDEFYLYDEKDRAYIPIGGWSERRLVRANAVKRKDYIVEDLEYKIKEAESGIKSLEWDIERMKKELTLHSN